MFKKKLIQIKDIAKTTEFLATFTTLALSMFFGFGNIVTFVGTLIAYLLVNGVRFWRQKKVENTFNTNATVDGTKDGQIKS